MYQQDYILRLIATVGQMLRTMVKATREQRPDDALEVARDAVEALLETDPAIADSMTGEGLVAFMAAGGVIDALRARMLAEILIARAEAYDVADRSQAAVRERDRALTLLDAAQKDADGEEADRIAELLGELGRG